MSHFILAKEVKVEESGGGESWALIQQNLGWESGALIQQYNTIRYKTLST